MIIILNAFSHFLDRRVTRSGTRISYKGLPEVDILFHEDNLEVKKLLSFGYATLWVIPLDIIICTS